MRHDDVETFSYWPNHDHRNQSTCFEQDDHFSNQHAFSYAFEDMDAASPSMRNEWQHAGSHHADLALDAFGHLYAESKDALTMLETPLAHQMMQFPPQMAWNNANFSTSRSDSWHPTGRYGSPDETTSSTSGSSQYAFLGLDATASDNDTTFTAVPTPMGSGFLQHPQDTRHEWEAQMYTQHSPGITMREIHPEPKVRGSSQRDAPVEEKTLVDEKPAHPPRDQAIETRVVALPDASAPGSLVNEDEVDFSPSSADDVDSDYSPRKRNSNRKSTTRSSNSNRQRQSAKARTKASKRRPARTSVAHTRLKSSSHAPGLSDANEMHQDKAARPFSCPAQPYGCHTTFTSKNEWKRHVTSQHLCLGYWRCDVCPDKESHPNDFNRKDLFTQHLRRMHVGRQSPELSVKHAGRGRQTNQSGQDDGSEELLEIVRSRCWVQARDPPGTSICVFCSKAFTGAGSCEEWLEHNGRHLAQMANDARRSSHSSSFKSMQDRVDATWRNDTVFRDWMYEHKLLRRDREGWALRNSVVGERHGADILPIGGHVDAEGDPE